MRPVRAYCLVVLVFTCSLAASRLNLADASRRRHHARHHCGRGNATNRIIGGNNAHLGAFPYTVAIESRFPPVEVNPITTFSGLQECTGTLIDQLHVVTAAHCVTRCDKNNQVMAPTSVKITAGDVDNTIQDYEQERYASGWSVHNNWLCPGSSVQSGYNENIALIRVDPPFTFQKSDSGKGDVSNVKVPLQGTDNQYTTGKRYLTVVGWGMDSTSGTFSKVLQLAQVVNPGEFGCRADFFLSRDKHICVRMNSAGGRSSEGDQGAPLMALVESGNVNDDAQIGVLSHAIGGNFADTVVFMRLSYYYSWIKHAASMLG